MNHPGPETMAMVHGFLAKLRASETDPGLRARAELRRLADRLRRTAEVGSIEQVTTALEWLRKPGKAGGSTR